MTTVGATKDERGGGTAHGAPRPGSGHIEVELAQSLGLFEALTIGIGTMIGAGIFVLPGFIVQEAGPAAVIAFAVGGAVALLNALAAAEIATGMPKSGGAYYFISRAMGPLWGAVIGWGSWFGLIFATAFYAVGFGEYVHSWIGVPVTYLAIGMVLLLVVLNLVGSKAAARAQNAIVAVLIAVMVMFLGRGAMDADPSLPFSGDGFMPFGIGAIFAGTATLFVTYCGFGEIASMAEEIKDPGRNLPRALIGSVVSVTVLYCMVLLLCVMLRPAAELTGATIVADLAGTMLGNWGKGAILVGAVMATVSSANASIMSASRICFAMGRDNMVWPWLNVVHPRFRVPHRAVLVTGGLIVGTLFLGGIEMLAEAAGLLHLLMYGLMSLACVILRGARPLNYKPVYRVPLFPWVPIAGALGTAAIACFIEPIIIAMSIGLITLAVLHYWFWARTRTPVRGSWPSFVRLQVLEPAMDTVERLGAAPIEPTTIVVTMRNPHREQARLRVADALLHDRRGRVVALNVFAMESGRTIDDDVLAEYRRTVQERARALDEQSAAIVTGRNTMVSSVPMAASVLPAILSTSEISRATATFLGWPAIHADQPARYDLVKDIAEYGRAHLLVLLEKGPVPPRDIVVITSDDDSGRLALGVAARLAAAWDVPLVAACRMPPDSTTEEIVAMETSLEERVIEVARASVRAIPAESQAAAAAAAAAMHQFIVVPSPAADADAMVAAMQEMEPVAGSSYLMVRARESRTMEPWV